MTTATEPRQLGIPFRTEMVRAIEEGRKTRTMRMIKGLPRHWVEGIKPKLWPEHHFCFYDMADPNGTYPSPFIARYRVGDLLYVKETWQDYCPLWKGYWCGHGEQADIEREHIVVYRADGEEFDLPGHAEKLRPLKWRSSMLMPKRAARLWRRVTKVGAQRPQDLLVPETYSEGAIVMKRPDEFSRSAVLGFDGCIYLNEAQAWHSLCQSIHGPGAWERNDWYFVYHFERVEKPE